MPLLIRSFSPRFRLFLGQGKGEVGAFGIGYVHLIDPAERFDDALLGKLPNVAGKRRRLVHQLPMIIENEVAKQFFTLIPHRLTSIRPATAAPKYAFDFWMRL